MYNHNPSWTPLFFSCLANACKFRAVEQEEKAEKQADEKQVKLAEQAQ